MTTIVNDVSDVGIYNIVADQGTTFMRSITYQNAAGTAINLGTGASAQMKVRKSYPATQNRAAYRDSAVLWTTTDTSTCTISSDGGAKITKSGHDFFIGDSVYFSPNFTTSAGNFTCTGSSATLTLASHTFKVDDTVRFTSTTTLPTGIYANKTYYIRNPLTNTFEITTLRGGSSSISPTTSGTGTHTVYKGLPASIVEGTAYFVVDDSSTDNDPTDTTFRIATNTGYIPGSSAPTIGGSWSANVSGFNSPPQSLTVTGGVIDIKIPSSYMSAIPAGIYDYDLEVTLGTSPGVGTVGDVIKIIRGLFEVRQEITY